MANANADKRVQEVPIDRSGDSERTRGKISYIYNTPSDPAGIFSFSYYYRPQPSRGNKNVQYAEVAAKFYTYIKGMTEQTKLTELAGSPFAGWKTVIYTDNATIQALPSLPTSFGNQATPTPLPPANEAARALFSHPNVIIALCEWPEYSQIQTGESIDGIILRVMRHKALMDFAAVPVFVRDADTYFTSELFQDNYFERLQAWETSLLQNQQASGKPFLVAGTPTYVRQWHANRKGGIFKSPGVLAGLVNSLGGISEWASGELWDQSLSYIRGYCRIHIEAQALSNIYEPTYVGKDEQIMIFVWIPALLDRTFFLYFDFHNHGGDAGEYLPFDWKYPKSRFHSVYEQLKGEFPQYVHEDGEIDQRMGKSPMSKLRGLMFGRPGNATGTPEGTPSPGGVHPFLGSILGMAPAKAIPPPPTPEENRAKMEENFAYAVEKGDLKPEDIYIIDYSDFRTMDLLNPFVVIHAFRNPVYQRIMFLMFEKITGLYRMYCEERQKKAAAAVALVAAEVAEGGRRRKRATKKRVGSRKTRTKRGTRTSKRR
jgi:hypothetical protein